MLKNSGTINKFLVALMGTVGTGLTTYYGTAKWLPAVLAGISALAVYLVPNVPNVPNVPASPAVTPVKTVPPAA